MSTTYIQNAPKVFAEAIFKEGSRQGEVFVRFYTDGQAEFHTSSKTYAQTVRQVGIALNLSQRSNPQFEGKAKVILDRDPITLVYLAMRTSSDLPLLDWTEYEDAMAAEKKAQQENTYTLQRPEGEVKA